MYILALVPVFVLLVLSLTKGVKIAVWTTTLLTTILFFYWGADFSHYAAALSVSGLTTLNILMIVFGATFLYTIMSDSGQIREMTQTLSALGDSESIRFFVIAFGMTAFFEGVAGFGTPGAIVPLILIAMGHDVLRSVSVVLLFDSLFSAFGAVGTPIISGLQEPLELSVTDVGQISLWSASALVLVGGVMVWIINSHSKFTNTKTLKDHETSTIWLLYLFFVIPYVAFAYWLPELATVMASFLMLSLSVIYLPKTAQDMHLKAWIPYATLAIFLLLPKIWPWLHRFLNVEVGFINLLDTGIGSTMRPLLNPMLPFLLVGICVAWKFGAKTLHLRSSFAKVGTVAVILYPSIVIAQLMIHSGAYQPSMVDYLAQLMGDTGIAYPFLSPFIGVMGTFITGSTTLSNVVFAPSQHGAAAILNMDSHVILALQHSGASIGNAICLFNIIAAASIAGITNYTGVLSNNVKPTLWITVILGILGLGFVNFVR